MPFRYLRDPLFLVAVGLYLVNRLVLKRMCSGGFVHESLNDLICIPFWAPIVVFLCRRLGVRQHDEPPHPMELMLIVASWSVLFEILLPRHPYWSRWALGDPWDVVYYTLGALLSALFWGRWYGVKAHRNK